MLNPCLAFGVLALLVIGAFGSKCPKKYQRFSAEHTYCAPADKTCDLRANTVTEADKMTILDEHNKYRNDIALRNVNTIGLPTASDMMLLVWDDELAAIAQKHADRCNFKHDCDECRRVPNFSVGQNLFTGTVTGSSKPPKVDWKKAVWKWYDEIKFFKPEFREPYVPSASVKNTYGHFTQVVWGATWRLGCGYAMYGVGKNAYTSLYVCNYGPGGNIKSGVMYEMGEPCSKCPENSCCGNTCKDHKRSYSGLCQMLRAEAPKYEISDKFTFSCRFSGEKDCETTTDGKEWQIVQTFKGNYASIVLNGGEKSTLTFTTPLAGKGGICFTFTYSKGADRAGDAVNSKVVTRYVIQGTNSESTLAAGPANNVRYSMNMGWDYSTTVKLLFSVPKGAPAQFFQISDLSAKNGRC